MHIIIFSFSFSIDFQRNISWSEYANENNANFDESGEIFKEVVYDDIYNFVPLMSGMESAKVCTDDQSFCCLAEFNADFNGSDVFSLGKYRI